MTGGAFDRLLYTDCRAGTGRGGGGGFQVQAQSAEVDAGQSRMAVRWLLYDAQNAWIMQNRPVEDFPLGFAHCHQEGYGTAQSRYVGKEATGGRRGNHLADCLLTRDPDLYGPTRPAQLWRSELWRAEPWDTKDCPQLAEAPPPGPLTVEAVAAWLRAQPERADALARLLTVLEDPAGRNVVITASGPDEALRWIAGATLLLPVRAALEVSFKVFRSHPWPADQRIVAVPRELNAQLVPGRTESAFILDADEAVSDDTAVSERSRFWVGRLAAAEDPYDVVDAVELAEALQPGAGPDPADAMVTAWAVTAPDQPLTDPAALLRCLSGADPAAQREHGPAVTARVLDADPPPSALRWIDEAAGLGRFDIDRGALRGALLAAEIAAARAGSAAPGEVLVPVPADASARRDADSELSSAILLGSDAEVALLLPLGRRYGIEPQLPPLLDRLRTFVLTWIDDQRLDYHPGNWALRDEILDVAHAELRLRLSERGVPAILGALDRLGPHFADRPGDPADPLDWHLAAVAIRALSGPQRQVRVSALLAEALRTPRPDTAMAGIQRALADWQAVGPAEAISVLMALPARVPIAPEILTLAVDELGRLAGRPTDRVLDVLEVLERRSLLAAAGPLLSLRVADREVRGFIDGTRTAAFQQDVEYARRCVAFLGTIEPSVVRCRLGQLLDACLDFPFPGLGVAVLCVLPAPVPRLLIDLWGRELGGPRSVHAAIWAVHWLTDPLLPEPLTKRMAAAVDQYQAQLKPDEREQWIRDVQLGLGPEQAGTWAWLAGFELAKPRRGRRNRDQDG
jgi:GTPase-associated protein 1, N-terminal domain type 2/GTPase-associated protein 1, middle domain